MFKYRKGDKVLVVRELNRLGTIINVSGNEVTVKTEYNNGLFENNLTVTVYKDRVAKIWTKEKVFVGYDQGKYIRFKSNMEPKPWNGIFPYSQCFGPFKTIKEAESFCDKMNEGRNN